MTDEQWLDDLISRGRSLYDACVPILESAEEASVEDWKALHVAFASASLFREPGKVKAVLLADRARMEKALKEIEPPKLIIRRIVADAVEKLEAIEESGEDETPLGRYKEGFQQGRMWGAKEALGLREGSASGDGGAGVPVRSLSVHETDKSDRAEGVADLLKDPKVVHINMLRGGIAKLTPAQIGHLYRGDEAAEVIREVARQNPEAEGVAALQQAAGDECDDFFTRQVEEAMADPEWVAKWSLPQQTALVEEGVEKIIAQHEPAACGEGTLPSPSDPPRSDGQTFVHDHAYHWAGAEPQRTSDGGES